MEKCKPIAENGEQLHTVEEKGSKQAFFERNWTMFFSPLIVVLVYVAALVGYGGYPFGDYTVASYDLSAQICPFIEHIFDVFDGKSSLSYSYAIAGGADVLGTFLYFFISPFSFLFLVCGDGMVLQATSFVIPLKLAAIAVAGTWFAKKLFHNIPDYLCVAVGVTYTYCGYTFVSNTYINWMDFLIYLPFCAGAFRRFVQTGKFLPFALLTACCIYTCFSIACFSMFTAFPVLVFYALLCVEKERRNKFIAYLGMSFLVAILLSLPVLLPALAAYLRGGRGGGLFENLWFGFNVLENGALGEFSSKVFLDTWGESLFRKWTYILSDSVFFILTLVWFFRKGLKTPFAKFMAVAGAFTLIPTIVDEAMLLMNMGSYMSYALRFGFLNALYFLGGACLAMDGLCYQENCAYDGSPLTLLGKRSVGEKTLHTATAVKTAKKGGKVENNDVSKRNRNAFSLKNLTPHALVFLGVGVATFAFLLWFISGGNYKTIWGGVVEDSSLRSTLKSFSGRFAHSLGGLEVIALVFGIIALVAGVGCAFAARKKISVRLLSYVLIGVVGVQVLFYNNQLVLGNRSTQHQKTESYQHLAQVLNERDESYFRVKDYADSFTSDVPFAGGTNSFSVFSSVIDADNFIVYNLFGYKGNGKNNLKSAHNQDKIGINEEFGDSFLGYKYYVVPKSEKAAFDKDRQLKKYVKPVMIEDENGEKVQLFDGDYYVYENEIVFPSAYRVAGGEFRFEQPNEANSSYRKANQRALYAYLRGKTLEETQEEFHWTSGVEATPESMRELSKYLWARAATDLTVGEGRITATVTGAQEGECLFLNFVASKGYRVFVNGKERTLVDNDLKFLCVELDAGDNEVEFVYSSPYVKYALVGAAVGLLGLAAVWFVVKKTKLIEFCAPVISWAGIALATALTAFFLLYPTSVWAVKIVKLLL